MYDVIAVDIYNFSQTFAMHASGEPFSPIQDPQSIKRNHRDISVGSDVRYMVHLDVCYTFHQSSSSCLLELHGSFHYESYQFEQV